MKAAEAAAVAAAATVAWATPVSLPASTSEPIEFLLPFPGVVDRLMAMEAAGAPRPSSYPPAPEIPEQGPGDWEVALGMHLADGFAAIFGRDWQAMAEIWKKTSRLAEKTGAGFPPLPPPPATTSGAWPTIHAVWASAAFAQLGASPRAPLILAGAWIQGTRIALAQQQPESATPSLFREPLYVAALERAVRRLPEDERQGPLARAAAKLLDAALPLISTPWGEGLSASSLESLRALLNAATLPESP